MNIAVAMANTGTIKTDTMFSVISLIYETKHRLIPMGRTLCYVQSNRYLLVKDAQQHGCQKILFVDADMKFAPDTLNRLLAHRKPIVGANYYCRQFPLTSTVKIPGTEGPSGETGSLDKIADLPSSLFECYAVGTGCMLIDMDVFRTLPQPWFQVTHKPDGDLLYGEDVWFCRQARQHGFSVWCDPTLNVGHIGDFEYKNYEQFPDVPLPATP